VFGYGRGPDLKRHPLVWAIVVVAVAGLVIYAPALLARASTGSREPINFLTQPQQGWRFVLTAAAEIPSAHASTPGRARSLAVADFAGTAVQPVRVDLLWVPTRRVALLGEGSRVATAKAALVWAVTGREQPGGSLRTIGLIDFRSGRLTYDVRTAR
jgi:hypothetical protein